MFWVMKNKKNKKKKKLQQQQQPAFSRRPLPPHEVYEVQHGPKKTFRLVTPKNVQQAPQEQQTANTFQAPHHQQESMIELSDDTSPNTPLPTSAGSWKPVSTAASSSQSVPPPQIKITRQEKIWRDFKESLTAKPIYKIGEKEKHVEPTKPEEDKKSEYPIKPQSTEIKWELNILDDKDETLAVNAEKQDSTPAPVPTPANPPKPQVIHGTASEIKLFPIKDKQGTVQKTIPKNEEATPSTSGNPSMSNISTSSSMTMSASNVSASNIPGIDISNNNIFGIPKRKEPSQTRQGLVDVKSYSSGWTYGWMYGAYPKGVPRSFLKQQDFNNLASIHLQDQTSNPNLNRNFFEEPGLQIQTEQSVYNPEEEKQYSPTDVYDDNGKGEQGADSGSVSPDGQGAQKRLSAFRRLGPVSQPKKPKLTINLLCNKDQSVREVREDEIEDKYTPVHLRKDIIESSDEIVKKYLPYWPWRRNVALKKTVTSRSSKTVMMLEQEQMEEAYDKDNVFIQVSVRGYPRSWKKEHVLDVLLDCVKGKSFIPCFTEFSPEECKFLVIRSRSALVCIHKLGFYIHKDDVELCVAISLTEMSLKQIDFIPRLVLRKQLASGYDGERKLSLKEFTLKSDVSHFIYFPLNRGTNQTELVQLQSTVAWNFLTDLDLSHNRITSIDGFNLPTTTPKLKHLDLSHNRLDKVTCLLHSRELSLQSIKLEGNPLCHDYIDPRHYVRVVKMIFPALTEIDGVPIHLKGDLPKPKRNYCPSEAEVVASKYLEVFFPLLELPYDERSRIEDMYHEKAVLTVTYRYNLRYSSLHRKFRNIFVRARIFDEGDAESVEGAPAIARLVAKWPMIQHDPYTFTLDVLHHSDDSTILRVGGILKLTSETLAEDEHLLAFTRTVVLTTLDGIEYKILNEMVFWDEPCRELANVAFQMNTIRTTKQLSLKLDSAPDEDLKAKLTKIFMSITELDKKASERCLQLKEWNLKSAIEHFMKLVKLDDLNSLRGSDVDSK